MKFPPTTLNPCRTDAPRRVTLDDVAEAAGVSPAAVSLALRGKAGVARATRQRIVDVAAGLGYHVRPAKGPPAEYTIGLLLATKREGPPERSYGPVVTAITAACSDAGADVRLGTLALDDADEPVGRTGAHPPCRRQRLPRARPLALAGVGQHVRPSTGCPHRR